MACSANTGGLGVRARTLLSDGQARCARCSAGAVDTQSDVAPVVVLVRPLLQSFGIRLPNQVKAQLISPGEIAERMGAGCAGYTATRRTGIGLATVAELRIVRGLPATMFGGVLAHEMGHGWLAGCPDIGRTPHEDEGLCELVASWWFQHRGGRLAAHLLDAMRSDPDPVYGEGFRHACRVAQGLSPPEIVARVSRTGWI